jgi:hypothetical protein
MASSYDVEAPSKRMRSQESHSLLFFFVFLFRFCSKSQQLSLVSQLIADLAIARTAISQLSPISQLREQRSRSYRWSRNCEIQRESHLTEMCLFRKQWNLTWFISKYYLPKMPNSDFLRSVPGACEVVVHLEQVQVQLITTTRYALSKRITFVGPTVHYC